MRLEVYSPPYLFAGPRPVITAAPAEWTYGQALTISTPQAGNIKWASIIRPGVTTHSFDNSQRLVDLAMGSQAGGQIQAVAPAQATLARPGWYMLFITDSTGVPSVATSTTCRREASRPGTETGNTGARHGGRHGGQGALARNAPLIRSPRHRPARRG